MYLAFLQNVRFLRYRRPDSFSKQDEADANNILQPIGLALNKILSVDEVQQVEYLPTYQGICLSILYTEELLLLEVLGNQIGKCVVHAEDLPHTTNNWHACNNLENMLEKHTTTYVVVV